MKSRKYLAFLKPKKKLRFIEGKIEGMYGRLITVKVQPSVRIEKIISDRQGRAGVFYEDWEREFSHAATIS